MKQYVPKNFNLLRCYPWQNSLALPVRDLVAATPGIASFVAQAFLAMDPLHSGFINACGWF